MIKTFLTAEWRKLIMANYEVPASILTNYIPAGTELDLWNGRCLVSLVGFRFLDTKVKGFGIPFHRNFTEINLRFYVRYYDKKFGWKRGTVFIKEIVPLPAITFVAKQVYGEKYETMPMKYFWKQHELRTEIEYACYKQQWHAMKVVTNNQAIDIAVGSEEEFITEHYWGYTTHQDKTKEYGVQHPRWQVYKLEESEIKFDFKILYGSEFEFLNSERPTSVFLAEGSAIKVMQGLVVERY
jgi:uncharacterized protein